METELRRLNRWSWIFLTAGAIRALVFPLAAALLASGGVLFAWLHVVSLVFLIPAFIYAFIRQKVYSYRFTDDELIVRDGLLTRNVRTIPYDRIHNVALVRNPIHRMLGVTTARVETAAGGQAEALLQVLSLEAAEELRRYTLGAERSAELTDSADPDSSVTTSAIANAPLLQVPDRELLKLGLISNRGFLVIAAAVGALSQVQWWDQEWLTEMDWVGTVQGIGAQAPDWADWIFESGRLTVGLFLGVTLILFLLVFVRILSMAWYLVRYRDFTLRQKDQDIRADYGVWPEVSSAIPSHRIQLVTLSASLLARFSDRTSIDVETAGAVESASGPGSVGAEIAGSRQWLAPIIETNRATGLVQQVLPEIDIEGVEWKPIEARAARRFVNRIAVVLTPITFGIAALFSLTSIPISGWHALWLPGILLPTTWVVSRQWVKRAGYALTEKAIYYRSGWLSREVSAVRFVNMQTVSMRQTPFDRRRRMATLAVDTAGAGGMGHRIRIPFLDVDVAGGILRRLYDETRATEFRW